MLCTSVNVVNLGFQYQSMCIPDACQWYLTPYSIVNVCPNSDLSILGFQSELTSTQQLIGKSTDNCAVLDDQSTGFDTCVTQFGYPFYGNITNPLKLGTDAPGTEPLSNMPGNAFTVFGADSYTLALFPGYSSVITPAAFNANAGVATGTIQEGSAVVTATSAASGTSKSGVVAPTVTGKQSGSAATGKGTNTGSAPASTSSQSAGTRVGGYGWAMGGALVGMFFFLY